MPALLNFINGFGRCLNSKRVRDTRLLVLLGPPRSNSTLIHRLLGEHSEVVSPGLAQLAFPGMLAAPLRTALRMVPQSRVDKMYSPQIHSTGADCAEADDIALLAAFSEGVFAWAYGDALEGARRPHFDPEKHLGYLAWLRGYVGAQAPGKTVCSKYFGGLHHFEALRERHPEARFVLLMREPKRVCYSLSTLIETALTARGLEPRDRALYFQHLYEYVVDTYRQAMRVMHLDDPRVLVVWDEEVKDDLSGVMADICEHAGLRPNESSSFDDKLEARLSQGPYERKYSYSTVLDDIFDVDDFADYYSEVRKRNDARAAVRALRDAMRVGDDASKTAADILAEVEGLPPIVRSRRLG